MKVLAIDQGTTSTRAMIHDGQVLHPVMQRAHRQILPAPGHVEHDPDELLQSLDIALRCEADLVAIANQGESCLGWDARDGRPVGPLIVWQDDRTAADCDRLRQGGAGPEVMARAGLPLDPYFSASKLGWIMRHVPEAQRLARAGHLRLGTTDAFFRDRLTGRFETDIATASRTSLMNLEKGEWDETLCRIFGVPISALPAITPTAGEFGRLPSGARLAVSIVDQQAALYGHGCRAPGDAKITFGTGAFVQCLTDGLIRPESPGPLPTIAWQFPGAPPCHALDGAVYAAAAAVDWAKSLGLFSDYHEINAFPGTSAIDRGLLFLPALAGLGCPHWDRAARGAWFGMTLSTDRRDMMQALLEGIALRVAEAARAIDALQPLRAISVDGGLARNAYLLRFLSGLLTQPIRPARTVEATALGLADMTFAAEGISRPTTAPPDPIPPISGDRSKAGDRIARFSRLRDAIAALSAETLPSADD
ncbi:glycerol kinase [Paracoccus aurantiacus]|uniref:ATP:glycerol 3-phosphotransferase n=1 Tax=Paracoccus aurantiacus TaxID=2599412 RepID=A0A5C6SAC0_9RHOB|nr:FGGY family carbohydrate kinase [Paracoccus aurantiacus]TXB70535.1 glycerol kinase [Paracoccus aurantiacus]